MTNILNSDLIDRTALLSIHDGSQLSLDAAMEAHSKTGIILCAHKATCRTVNGQAALLTAVLTSVRAFGNVLVVTDEDAVKIQRGVHRDLDLLEVITNEGATVMSGGDLTGEHTLWPILLIGSDTPIPTLQDPSEKKWPVVLRTSWRGWNAYVSPDSSSAKNVDSIDFVLASIAAAALGVSEVFAWSRHLAGSDAGYRSAAINLWSPADLSNAPETDQIFAPNAWWLVGLGHLGQANAWVISWLGYEDSSMVEVVLQDIDRTVPANHSTGVLTPRASEGRPKTRLLAESLDSAGFNTRIIERRLGPDLKVTPEERHHVALFGVDNVYSRRLISNVGWHFAIDVGLGKGPTNFNSILFRRFPGRELSHQVPAWIDNVDAPVNAPNTVAFDKLREDFGECGVIELAGRAVGASFVGVVAATISVSQALGQLLGGEGVDLLRLDLDSMFLVSEPSTVEVKVIGIPLIQ